MAAVGEGESLAAVVGGVGQASDQTGVFGPIDQFDGGVVAEFQPVGHLPDGGLRRGGASDGQEELMLNGVRPAALAPRSEKCRKERRARRNWARGAVLSVGDGPAFGSCWCCRAHVRSLQSDGGLGDRAIISINDLVCFRPEIITYHETRP